MLSPIAIATWLSFCVPWAEPRLAAALIDAGSSGEPYMIADAAGRVEISASQTEAIQYLRARREKSDPDSKVEHTELYLGLTQIPLSALHALAIEPEVVLDKCANLEIGYTLFLNAYQLADKAEKNPWKRIALTYNYFRSNQKSYETSYSTAAIDYLKSGRWVLPANMTSGLYQSVAAEWSAGLASRQAMRQSSNPSSILIASRALSDEIRKSY